MSMFMTKVEHKAGDAKPWVLREEGKELLPEYRADLEGEQYVLRREGVRLCAVTSEPQARRLVDWFLRHEVETRMALYWMNKGQLDIYLNFVERAMEETSNA